MSQATIQGQLGLMTIPVDILYEITSHLDYGDAFQLAGASSGLRGALHPLLTSPDASFPLSVEAKQTALRCAEKISKQHIRNLACFTCMRMLPREAFSASNRRGDRGKGVLACDPPSADMGSVPDMESEGRHWYWRASDRFYREEHAYWAKRFCWDCGIKHLKFPHMQGVRRYPKKRRSRQDRKQDPQDPIMVARVARERAQEVWYLCHQCGQMKTKENMCLPVPWAQLEEGERQERKARGHPKMLCSGIFDDDLHKHDYCHQSTGSSRPRSAISRLELLPEVIQYRIFGHLPYRDKIMLSQTSRHFAAAVQPSSSIYYPFSLNEKYDFIRRCEETKRKLETEHRQDDLACYGCFRMRPEAKFCFDQLRQTVWGYRNIPRFNAYSTGFRRVPPWWDQPRDSWRPRNSPRQDEEGDSSQDEEGDSSQDEEWDGSPDRVRKRRCNSCLAKMFYLGLLKERPTAYRFGGLVRNANRQERTWQEDEEAMKRLFLFGLQELCKQRHCRREGVAGQMVSREVMSYSRKAWGLAFYHTYSTTDESLSGIKGFECWGCVHRVERGVWIAKELERLRPKTRPRDSHGPDDEYEPDDDDEDMYSSGSD
ncbi:hypothetical protein QBC37DRAFT_397195 [Rhypophila decipiens]|uniref:F-box domain-containing protein n=1 Tax=Rhypophila decipiens TaxID=261697 RepID=A0AAN6YIL9_9PEZI|nr:hypothetical protein QBC37DRAFT_397195 [Rhypophila decipiens]